MSGKEGVPPRVVRRPPSREMGQRTGRQWSAVGSVVSSGPTRVALGVGVGVGLGIMTAVVMVRVAGVTQVLPGGGAAGGVFAMRRFRVHLPRLPDQEFGVRLVPARQQVSDRSRPTSSAWLLSAPAPTIPLVLESSQRHLDADALVAPDRLVEVAVSSGGERTATPNEVQFSPGLHRPQRRPERRGVRLRRYIFHVQRVPGLCEKLYCWRSEYADRGIPTASIMK